MTRHQSFKLIIMLKISRFNKTRSSFPVRIKTHVKNTWKHVEHMKTRGPHGTLWED